MKVPINIIAPDFLYQLAPIFLLRTLQIHTITEPRTQTYICVDYLNAVKSGVFKLNVLSEIKHKFNVFCYFLFLAEYLVRHFFFDWKEQRIALKPKQWRLTGTPVVWNQKRKVIENWTAPSWSHSYIPVLAIYSVSVLPPFSLLTDSFSYVKPQLPPDFNMY